MEFLFIFMCWIICGIICAVIAGNKNRNAAGWFFLGLLIGIFGVIIIAVLDPLSPVGGAGPYWRYDGKNPWTCYSCGQKNAYWDQKCVYCGKEPIPPPPTEKKCPRCAEMVKAEAQICRFCRYEFPT